MLRLIGQPAPNLLARGYDENIAALTTSITGSEREKVRALIGDRLHLIVDEFQDLPGVRGNLVLALLDLLAPAGKTGTGFTVLGDPAQAIYGFATSSAEWNVPTSAEYWTRIKDTYGPDLEVIGLTHNYRADRPLAKISSSLRSVLLSPRKDGEKLHIVREVVATLPSWEESVGPSWINNGDYAKSRHTNPYKWRIPARATESLRKEGRRRVHACPTARWQSRIPSSGMDCRSPQPPQVTATPEVSIRQDLRPPDAGLG